METCLPAGEDRSWVVEAALRTGIPITIENGDDVAAEVEVSLYNAATGVEQPANEPFVLPPGDTTIIRLEPTRGRDEAFQLIINGLVAVTSDFLGCGDDMEPPLPEELLIVVLPNGQPDACSHWPGSL